MLHWNMNITLEKYNILVVSIEKSMWPRWGTRQVHGFRSTISLSFRYEIERFQCTMSHKWMTYMLHVNPSMKNSHTQIWTLIPLFRKYVPRETDFLLTCLSVCGFPQFELTATCAYTFIFQLHSTIVCHLRHFCRWCTLTDSKHGVLSQTALCSTSLAKRDYLVSQSQKMLKKWFFSMQNLRIFDFNKTYAMYATLISFEICGFKTSLTQCFKRD